MRKNQDKNYILNSNQYHLLMRIINDNRLFDRRDNTFLQSNRKIACRLKCSPSKVDQLFRVLSKNGLVKTNIKTLMWQTDKPCRYKMLDPYFLWISYSKLDKYYHKMLYQTESLESVNKWRNVCKELDCIINPLTGEMLHYLNWTKHHLKESEYTCFDRCYRRGYSSQLIDLEMDGQLSDHDIEWFKLINKSRS